MPLCTLGDPLPYITGSYHKATTFVIGVIVNVEYGATIYVVNCVRCSV
jgi:hypothetical protein